MKHRRVFSAPSVAVAEAALRHAVGAGIAPDHAALIGRPETEARDVPDHEKEAAPTDFKPAVVRGLVGGAVLGLLLGAESSGFSIEANWRPSSQRRASWISSCSNPTADSLRINCPLSGHASGRQ